MTALTLAAKSGVDVRIMMPHVPDKKLIFLLAYISYRSLSAAQTAAKARPSEQRGKQTHKSLMVIDASKGVEAQTIKLFKVCVLRHIPIFTFINKMDREANVWSRS